jgi:hypothetical protein
MIRGVFGRRVAELTTVLVAIPLFGAQDATPTTIQLPDGTPIHLYLKDDLDSKSSRKGDLIRFQVREDVVVRNVVVIPAGSVAEGHVTAVGHRGMAGHSGRLSFCVDHVAAPDGTKVPVVSAPNLSGGSNGKVAAAAAVTYGPEALLMRGWNAVIRKGTMLNAYVNGDHDIGMANLTVHPSYALSSANPSPQPSAPLPPARAPTTPESPETIAVPVGSTPDGADIVVDQKFVGNTPSTVRLTQGDHTISIEKSGFKPWQRTITVTAGASPTINVTLEKE